MKRIVSVLIVIYLLLMISACVAAPNSSGTSSRNYNSYLGIWVSGNNTESEELVHKQGGGILEIIEIRDNYIRGSYRSIQSAPALRLATFDFEGILTNDKLQFNYEDTQGIEGEGILMIKDNEIEIILYPITDTKRSLWRAKGGLFVRPKQ